MRAQKAPAARRSARRGQAVDVVVAVALDVREPEQRDQRQVLLHGEAGLRGQVFAGQEVARGVAGGSSSARSARR